MKLGFVKRGGLISTYWYVFTPSFKINQKPGHLLKFIAGLQMRYKPGSTITKLALNIGNVMVPRNVPKNFHFDDDGYFYKEEDEEEEKGHSNGVNNKRFVC